MGKAQPLHTFLLGMAMELPPEDKFMFDGYPGEPSYSGAVKLAVILGGAFCGWSVIAAAVLPFVLR